MAAASAPFLHLHADAAHETSHHDGRVVHSHFATHTTADDHRHDHDDKLVTVQATSTDDTSSVYVSTEPESVSVGGSSARLSVQEVPVGPPHRVMELIPSPMPVTPPPDNVDHRLSSPPDLGTSSLRGPPR
jgi:hypothetical protein